MFRYANASGLIYRVKHIYFDTTSRTLPLCTDHIASTGLHKHCNFVVTIITSCYVSPNGTSFLDPSWSAPTHFECAYGL